MTDVTAFGSNINQMTSSSSDISKDVQADFLKAFGACFSQMLKDSIINKDSDAISTETMQDLFAQTLSDAGVDSSVSKELIDLFQDPEVISAFSNFDSTIAGESDDSLTSPSEGVLPSADEVFPDQPTWDAGLNGQIKSLEEYSDYISGAGTSFGGFAIDLPSTLVGGVGLVTDLSHLDRLKDTFKYNTLMKAIKNGDYDDDPILKSALQQQVTSLSNSASDKTAFEKGLGEVSSGLTVATSLFGVVQSGINIAAGSEKEGVSGDLRVAGGALGISKGIYNLSSFMIGKIATKAGGETAENVAKFFSKSKLAGEIADVGWDASSTLTKAGVGFATVVGSAFAIGMGVLSITKNAMAADAQRQKGNHGGAAMYGVMAALDGVSIVLDVASLICDFVPVVGQLVSLVLDAVNFVISAINTLIGVFADQVDTRTPEEKLNEKLDNYVDSDQFKAFIDKQAQFFKNKGYDAFEYLIDAQEAGLDEEGIEKLADFVRTTKRELTAKANEFYEDKTLRMAIIDGTSTGQTLNGRENDDYLDGRKGNDILYGHGGNDVLIGGIGDDRLVGGEGDDVLDGGTGNDNLNGGGGDDSSSGGPGDDNIDSGEGNDFASPGIGDDIVNMGPGDDYIKGLLGDDVIDGGLGQDTVDVDITEIAQQFSDTVNSKYYKPAPEPDYVSVGYKVDLSEGTATANPEVRPLPTMDFNEFYSSNSYRYHLFSGTPSIDIRPLVVSAFRDAILKGLEQKGDITFGSSEYQKYSKVSAYIKQVIQMAPNLKSVLYSPNPVRNHLTIYLAEEQGSGFDKERVSNYFTDYLNQAKAEGRQVYWLSNDAKLMSTIQHSERYDSSRMRALSDGESILLIDKDKGYVEIPKDKLNQFPANTRTSAIYMDSWTDTVDSQESAGYYNFLIDAMYASASLENIENIKGSNFSDHIIGNDQDNVLIAADGSWDRLEGRGGNDVLVASGRGTKVIDGGEGVDTLSYANSGSGVNVNLAAGTANEGGQQDSLTNIENIVGSNHSDTIIGDDGANQIVAGNGADTVNAGGGNDYVEGGSGANTLNGGAGIDTAAFSGTHGVTASLAQGEAYRTASPSRKTTLSSFENIVGSNAADTLEGDGNNNILQGGQGEDILRGLVGDDSLQGGTKNDALYGGEGNDRLSGGEGLDTLDGGEGFDTVDYSLDDSDRQRSHSVTLRESGVTEAKDRETGEVTEKLVNIEGIIGGDAIDRLIGNSQDNLLSGGGGDDYLAGGAGNDILIAEGGTDTLKGDEGKDIFQIKEGGHAITSEKDEGNALVFEGVTLSEIRFILDQDNGRFKIIKRDDGSVLFEDRILSSDVEGWQQGQVNDQATMALAVSFANRFSTIRVGDQVLNQQSVFNWIRRSIWQFSGSADDGDIQGNTLSNYIESSMTDGSIQAGAGNDVIHVLSGKAEINTGSGEDYVDLTRHTSQTSRQQAVVNVGEFAVVEVGKINKVTVNTAEDTSFSLVLHGSIEDWGFDGMFMYNIPDEGYVSFTQLPESIIFASDDRRILIQNVTEFYEARSQEGEYQHRWELVADGRVLMNIPDVKQSDVSVSIISEEGDNFVYMQKGGEELLKEKIPQDAPEHASYGDLIRSRIKAIQFSDNLVKESDLGEFITNSLAVADSKEGAGKVLTSDNAMDDSSSGDRQLSRLTDAMASFDDLESLCGSLGINSADIRTPVIIRPPKV